METEWDCEALKVLLECNKKQTLKWSQIGYNQIGNAYKLDNIMPF